MQVVCGGCSMYMCMYTMVHSTHKVPPAALLWQDVKNGSGTCNEYLYMYLKREHMTLYATSQ